MAEFDLIDILKSRCTQRRADVHLGIGDDAAVVAVPADMELVICTDTMVAGVHFPFKTDPADLGWKSLAVNLSDLAAMGATPAWATLALTLPDGDADFVASFASGFAELAAQHGVALIGGDTTRGPLSVTVTAHGFVPVGTALRRNGAREGDAVFVTGTLGDAAAGLCCLAEHPREKGIRPSLPAPGREALLARLSRPQPRVTTGQSLRGSASACIDLSDGLIADLGHIARASGVGIEIESAGVPASAEFLSAVETDRQGALQLAGGDDYELAFTVAERDIGAMQVALTEAGCQVTRIGRVFQGSGVRVLDRDGKPMAVQSGGWVHFA